MGKAKKKTLAEELINNRIRCINEYLKEELSLLDLCRLFETSPLGMTRILDQDPDLKGRMDQLKAVKHHPDRVKVLLFELRDELVKQKDDLPEALMRHGLIRMPSRFNEWAPGDKLMGEYAEVLEQVMKGQKRSLQKIMQFNGKDAFIKLLEPEKKAVYELYSLGFKNLQIQDYLRGYVKHQDLVTVLIKVFEKMTPATHAYEAYKRDHDKGKRSKSGEIKKSNPVRIAEKEELQRLFDAGASLKQIIMITGDQSVVIEDYRDEKGLKGKKKGKTKTGRTRESYAYKKKNLNHDMFAAYVDERNWHLTQTDLAKQFGTSRVTFSRGVKEYLGRASDQEKEEYERRVKASEAMRMHNIHSAIKRNRKEVSDNL